MCGKTLKDKARNENIRKIVHVENIGEYLRSQRLRWYGHVERMSQDKAPAMTRVYQVQGRKIRRPKKRWRKVINEVKNDRSEEPGRMAVRLQI